MATEKSFDELKEILNDLLVDIEKDRKLIEEMSKSYQEKEHAANAISDAIHSFIAAIEDLEKLDTKDDEFVDKS